MNWIEDLTVDELPGDLKLVGKACGISVALALAEKMGGMQIYIRPIKNLKARKKAEYIKKNFTGANHKELAIDTGYSIPWIYKILSKSA